MQYRLRTECLVSTGSKVRLATLQLAVLILKMLVMKDGRCYLLDRHLAAVEGAREEATLQLRNFYKVWEKVVYAFPPPTPCTLLLHVYTASMLLHLLLTEISVFSLITLLRVLFVGIVFMTVCVLIAFNQLVP
jgi:hypothetical protein